MHKHILARSVGLALLATGLLAGCGDKGAHPRDRAACPCGGQRGDPAERSADVDHRVDRSQCPVAGGRSASAGERHHPQAPLYRGERCEGGRSALSDSIRLSIRRRLPAPRPIWPRPRLTSRVPASRRSAIRSCSRSNPSAVRTMTTPTPAGSRPRRRSWRARRPCALPRSISATPASLPPSVAASVNPR